MRISVLASKDLQAVITRVRGLDREQAKQVRSATQKSVKPIWKESVNGNVTTRLESRVLGRTATTAVRADNVTLRAGHTSARMSGGARVFELTHHAEFGADQSYTRTVPGRGATGQPYKKRTRAQFRPRKRTGYTVYPAAADAIPRIAALWVQTVVRTTYEAFEGGSK